MLCIAECLEAEKVEEVMKVVGVDEVGFRVFR
jgi:hypothetical protein